MSAHRLDLQDLQADHLPQVQAWLGPLAAQALPDDPGAERWLVACERGQPVAALRVRRAIGLDRARAWYHLGCVVHASATLGLFNRQPRLLLGNDLCGAAELADAAWAPGTAAAVLEPALAALVQQALAWLQTPTQASATGTDAGLQTRAWQPKLLVELPGLTGPAGDAPFWDALGRHFCRTPPQAAAARLGSAWHGSLAALLPRQPVYLSFLTPAAQAAVGQVHPASAVWQRVLQQAGFAAGQHLTVHDGGPVWERPLPR